MWSPKDLLLSVSPVIQLPREEVLTVPDERNQLNMGLYSAVVLDEEFYELATEGAVLTVDKDAKTLIFQENGKSFSFSHSVIEETLLNAGGVLPLYERYGKSLFREMVKPKRREMNAERKLEVVLNSFQVQENNTRAQLVW